MAAARVPVEMLALRLSGGVIAVVVCTAVGRLSSKVGESRLRLSQEA